jgi:hypothetical protein
MATREFQSNSLAGRVGAIWEESGKPDWSLEKTVNQCKNVDEALMQEQRNPAPKFRAARMERDATYIDTWVRGCRFEWL